MMKLTPYILTILFFVSCNSTDQTKKSEEKSITVENQPVEYIDNASIENIDSIIDPEIQKQINECQTIMNEFNDLDRYKIYTGNDVFSINGDFFGDQIADVALLIEETHEVKLCVINFSADSTIYILGNGNDYDHEPNKSNYNWVGIFQKVEQGEVLWSNYEDDYRSLEDVPENEKVILSYDAIYVHASESCGGGFIFWKDEKFNWLQQE